MPKFVLIDHSLRDTAGHYYEYAVHVLRAAERAGYESTLITHVDFRTERHAEVRWATVPTYRYDVWGVAGRPSHVRRGGGVLARVRAARDRAAVSLAYSGLGYLLQLRPRWRSALALQAPGAKWLLILVPAGFVLAEAKAIWRVLMAALNPSRSTYVGGLVGAVWNVVTTTIAPVAVPFMQRRTLVSLWRERRQIQAFARDTARALSGVRLCADDIVFVPTLSDLDLTGLLLHLRRDAASTAASWHLLFRRNPYVGREPDYRGQDETIRPQRNRLVRFLEGTRDCRVFFYTDTDALTVQYQRFGVAAFETLPIPVNDAFKVVRLQQRDRTQPLRVSYVGDARAEKGYQHLPYVVGEMRAPRRANRAVTFALQSNFTAAEHRMALSVARAQLQAHRTTAVQVFPEALTSEAYRELVAGSDVGLLLYDRDRYYARSSGALVEYLAAGIPVIVPAGSWLSAQFEENASAHRARLRAYAIDVAPTSPTGSRRWTSTAGRSIGPLVDAQLTFGGETSRAFRWLMVPPNATHLLVSFRLPELSRLAHPGSYIRVHAEWLVKSQRSLGSASRIVRDWPTAPATALFSVPRSAMRCWLGLRNAFADFPVTIEAVEVAFLGCPDGSPSGAVGLTYSEVTEVPGLLREMCDHIEHYRETAAGFAAQWGEWHSADRLVAHLGKRARRPGRGRDAEGYLG